MGRGRLILLALGGVSRCAQGAPNPLSLGEGGAGVGRLLLMESLLFRNFRLCFPLLDVYDCLLRKSYQI